MAKRRLESLEGPTPCACAAQLECLHACRAAISDACLLATVEGWDARAAAQFMYDQLKGVLANTGYDMDTVKRTYWWVNGLGESVWRTGGTREAPPVMGLAGPRGMGIRALSWLSAPRVRCSLRMGRSSCC